MSDHCTVVLHQVLPMIEEVERGDARAVVRSMHCRND